MIRLNSGVTRVNCVYARDANREVPQSCTLTNLKTPTPLVLSTAVFRILRPRGRFNEQQTVNALIKYLLGGHNRIPGDENTSKRRNVSSVPRYYASESFSKYVLITLQLLSWHSNVLCIVCVNACLEFF